MSLELSEMAVAQTYQIWWGEIDRGSVLAAPDVCHVLPRLSCEQVRLISSSSYELEIRTFSAALCRQRQLVKLLG
jgi:hypothetical protein